MRSILELLEEKNGISDTKFMKQLEKATEYLNTKGKILLLTTSNRSNYNIVELGDEPKSTKIARKIQESLGSKCTLVDVSKLKIYNCEGNVSAKAGNNCGVREAKLKDAEKNPSGQLRCWASFNNEDDELWKVVTPLLECDVVVFLGSVRWGQTNAIYQKLIERLDWIENRWTTLGERNIVEGIESGFIFIGQNWNGADVVKTQKKVHQWYGFKPVDQLYFNWQFTMNANDESKDSYKEAAHALDNIFDIRDLLR